MSYATLEKQIRSLPEDCLDEVSNYIEYILYKRVKEKKADQVNELGDYFGILMNLPDGMNIQRGLRNEWN